MSYEEAVRLVVSFLGGGLVAGLLNWLREARSEQRRRRNERIKAQVEDLYGPLYFFSSQNDALFELVRKIHGAYDSEYSSKKWSPSEPTQSNLRAETTATIELANSYVRTANENSLAMLDILKCNYAHIDPDDEEIFRQFVIDQARLKQECAGDGPMRTPLAVYRKIGEISFMRPDFSARVREKFLAKKKVAKE